MIAKGLLTTMVQTRVAKVLKAVCKQASEASLGGRLWSENGRQRGADLFRCFRFEIQAKKS